MKVKIETHLRFLSSLSPILPRKKKIYIYIYTYSITSLTQRRRHVALTRQLGHREPRVIMKQSPAHEAISGLKDWRLLLSGWCLSCRKKNLCYLQKDKYITITISRGLNKRSYLGILPLGLNKRMQYTSWECT